MRTIIAGSRDVHFGYNNILLKAIRDCGWTITEVVSGCAQGADRLGELWADDNGIPVDLHPAHWEQFGKSAGYRRNVEMAEVAEALIALHMDGSKGTQHMIDIATKRGLKVYVVKI